MWPCWGESDSSLFPAAEECAVKETHCCPKAQTHTHINLLRKSLLCCIIRDNRGVLRFTSFFLKLWITSTPGSHVMGYDFPKTPAITKQRCWMNKEHVVLITPHMRRLSAESHRDLRERTLHINSKLYSTYSLLHNSNNSKNILYIYIYFINKYIC